MNYDPSGSAVFHAALRHADPEATPACISEALGVRVSIRGRAAIDGHLHEAMRHHEHHPVLGGWLDGLPDDILRHPDDEYRAQHGLLRVDQRHTHPSARGDALVGYVAVPVVNGRGCLVALVGTSASLATVSWEHLPRPMTLWALLILGMWSWASSARTLHFNRDDRMARDLEVFAPINGAVKERPGAVFYWGHERVDPHVDDWRAVIGATKSAADNKARLENTTSGAVSRLLRDGGWPHTVPVGYRRATTRDASEAEVADTTRPLVPDYGQSEELEAVLRGYANGASKTPLAVEGALLGARNGDGKLMVRALASALSPEQRQQAIDLLPSITVNDREAEVARQELRDAPSSARARLVAIDAAAAYVDRILNTRAVLRTGVHEGLRAAPSPTKGKLEYHEHKPTFVVDDVSVIRDDTDGQFVSEADLPDGHPWFALDDERRNHLRATGFWHYQLAWGSPVDLDEDTWQRIEERLRRQQEDFHARRASISQRPLAGLTWTQERDGRPWRLHLGGTGDTTSYQVLGAPVAELSSRGGMLNAERLAAIHTTELHERLARLLLDLDARSAAEPLSLLTPQAALPADDSASAQAHLTALRNELEHLEAVVLPGHARELAKLDEGSRQYRSAAIARDEDEQRAEELETRLIPAAEARLAPVGSQPDAQAGPPEAEAAAGEATEADFAQIRVAAATLANTGTTAPAALHNVLVYLLDGGAGLSNFRRVGKRQILIDVDARVALTDGSVEWIHAGTLDVTDRRQTPTRKKDFITEAARILLRDRQPVVDVATRFGWTVGELLTLLSQHYLAPAGIDRELRPAILLTAATDRTDLPTPEVVHALVEGEPTGALDHRHGAWIVEQIRSAYLGGPGGKWAHAKGFVRRPLEAFRTAVVSVAASGRTHRKTLAGAVDGIANEQMVKDFFVPGRASHWQPPLLIDERGWLEPHRCRRSLCPGGGNAPMTGFTPVPELLVTGDAVFCEYCHHSLHGNRLPEVYTLPWDVADLDVRLIELRGIPFVAEPPRPVSLGKAMLSSREFAEQVDLPPHVIQAMCRDGTLPHVRSEQGRFRIPVDATADPAVTEAVTAAREHRGLNARNSDDRPNDGQRGAGGAGDSSTELSRDEALAHLKAAPLLLRSLVQTGHVTNHGTSHAPTYRRDELDALLDELADQLEVESASFEDVVTFDAAMKDLGITKTVLRNLVDHDLLHGVWLGNRLFISSRSMEELDPRIRRAFAEGLRLAAAAEQLGLGEDIVRDLARNGQLPCVHPWRNAIWLFLPDELEWWRSTREQQQGSLREGEALCRACRRAFTPPRHPNAGVYCSDACRPYDGGPLSSRG